jgi:ribosome-binding protein aMBF1 (putative translation factor)
MYSGGTFNEIYEKYSSNPETKKNLEREGKRLETAIALMKLREEEGLSQRELAKKVGKPQSTIARIENGSMNVTFDTLMDIVLALGRKMTISIK